MKPLIGMLALVVVASLVGTLVGRSTAPPTQAQTTQKSYADAGIDRLLPEVRFGETPLDKVIDSLRDQSHANLAVNWGVLESAGIDRQTPITLHLTNLPVGRVLEIVGMIAGGGVVKLGVKVDRGVIIFSTDEELSRDAATHIYDVRDLLRADHDFLAGPGATTTTTAAPGGQPQALFAASAPSAGPANPYSESVDRLSRLIQDQIAPDSWRDAGGTIGSIHDFDGMLIVVTLPEYHRQIVELLERLRKRS